MSAAGAEANESTGFDLVVVGSGIAGLYAALIAAPRARVSTIK